MQYTENGPLGYYFEDIEIDKPLVVVVTSPKMVSLVIVPESKLGSV